MEHYPTRGEIASHETYEIQQNRDANVDWAVAFATEHSVDAL